jgi:hypothetical protein
MPANPLDQDSDQMLQRFWRDETAAVFSLPTLCFSAVCVLVFWAVA